MMRAVPSSGTLLCLAAAAACGAMAAFGDAGATVGTLLTVRFGLAGLLALNARRPRRRHAGIQLTQTAT
jgi:hypothetical protein